MLLHSTWACRIVATRYVKSCHVLICCWVVPNEERYRQMKRQRSSLLFLGEEFIQFLAAPVILTRTILKNRTNSSFSFKSSCRVLSIQSKTSSVARFSINSSPQNSSDDLCLFFCFYTVLLWWYTWACRIVSTRGHWASPSQSSAWTGCDDRTGWPAHKRDSFMAKLRTQVSYYPWKMIWLPGLMAHRNLHLLYYILITCIHYHLFTNW